MEQKMEHEMETGVIEGFKELKFSYQNACICIYIYIYGFHNIVTQIKFLSTNPVLLSESKAVDELRM